MINSIDSVSLSQARVSSRSVECFFPDDVWIHILSRLQVKDVLRCRCVCRRWRDLPATSDLVDLHSRLGFPLIVASVFRGKEEIIFDKWWEPAETGSHILTFSKFRNHDMQFSLNGLIVLHEHYSFARSSPSPYHVRSEFVSFIILNPVNCENVTIMIPKSWGHSKMHAVFFHPLREEYCTLWRIEFMGWRILNLGSNPCWREIEYPLSQDLRFSRFPILINDYVCWLTQPKTGIDISGFNCLTVRVPDIMVFDIKKEEFTLVKCPVPAIVFPILGSNRNWFYNASLLNIDGLLSVVRIYPSEQLMVINISTLKDSEEQLWTSSDYRIRGVVFPMNRDPKVIACANGELVLKSDGRLYVCNLKLETARNFGRLYSHRTNIFSHVVSLASLRNCTSKICTTEDHKIMTESELVLEGLSSPGNGGTRAPPAPPLCLNLSDPGILENCLCYFCRGIAYE